MSTITMSLESSPRKKIPDNRVFKKGQLIAITSGEYEDYGVNSYVRVVKQFKVSSILKKISKMKWASDKIDWLLKSGYVEKDESQVKELWFR